MASWLCGFVPRHERYIEPFCGGAKLFFTKTPSPIEILNDADDILVNLYRVIQNDKKRRELIKILNKTPYARSVFNHFRQVNPEDEIEKAARYFYLSKASFAGDVARGGFACPSKNTIRNPAQTYQKSIDALEHIAKRLQGVTIECLDYKDCISKYDSESSLIFVDAPYLQGNSRQYYEHSFTLENHKKLRSLLNSIRGKTMFCHYEHPEIDKLYSGWHRYTFESFKGSYKSDGEAKPITNECLYTNFQESCKQKFLFQEMN